MVPREAGPLDCSLVEEFRMAARMVDHIDRIQLPECTGRTPVGESQRIASATEPGHRSRKA